MAVTLVVLSGSVLAPDGVAITSGHIRAKLSQPGSTLDGAVSQRVATEANGTITAGVVAMSIVPNDAITPSGTYYVAVYDCKAANGKAYRWSEKWQVASSPSTQDIGAVPRLEVVPGVSLAPYYVPGNASAMVVDSGGTVDRTLSARFSDVVWATDYGVTMDGATDDTTAVLAAITAAMTLGKELRFPPGTCRINGQLAIPNDGASPPLQKPLRIVGSGATMNGRGATAGNGGTILDMRYAGTNGKILTMGLGHLEVTGITFTDSAGGTLPWLYTTNTTLHVHGCAFIGSKTGTACDQDCIILGGNTAAAGGAADPDHGFQGYGTVIRENYFNRVRRAVWGRTYANSVVVRDNCIWSQAGSNLADGAAIEFDNTSGNSESDSGNVIDGNLIEVTNYPYGIKMGKTASNFIAGNSFWDATATTLAGVRFESNALYNLLMVAYLTTGKAEVSDASSVGGSSTNTVLTGRQAGGLKFATAGTMVLKAETDGVVQESGTGAVPYAHFRVPGGDAVYQRMTGTAGRAGVAFWTKPSGSLNRIMAYLANASDTSTRLELWGSSGGQLLGVDGDLTLSCKAASKLYLGRNGYSPVYVEADAAEGPLLVLNAATARIRVGSATGPLIRAGSGSPEGVVTAPTGSLFLRTDGGAATSLYVKETGTGNTGWVGK